MVLSPTRPTNHPQPEVNNNNQQHSQQATPQHATPPGPRPQAYHVDNRERGYLWNRMMLSPTRPANPQQPETNNNHNNRLSQKQANPQQNAAQPRQRPHSHHFDKYERGFLWNRTMV